MEKFDYVFSGKDLVAIKIAYDYENGNNIEYSKSVLGKIGILFELVDSLFQQNIQMPTWQIWFEPLLIKLGFHSVSMIQMFTGIKLPFTRNNKITEVLDESSIIILLRVILENYLTFFYLYCDRISDEEKRFRLNIWRYCGIKQRVEFDLFTSEAKQKQNQETIILHQLKNEIEQSIFFQAIDAKKQKIILKGTKPRMFNNWMDLMKSSGLGLSISRIYMDLSQIILTQNLLVFYKSTQRIKRLSQQKKFILLLCFCI